MKLISTDPNRLLLSWMLIAFLAGTFAYLAAESHAKPTQKVIKSEQEASLAQLSIGGKLHIFHPRVGLECAVIVDLVEHRPRGIDCNWGK